MGGLLHPSLSRKKKWTGKDIIFKIYNRKYANRELIMLHANLYSCVSQKDHTSMFPLRGNTLYCLHVMFTFIHSLKGPQIEHFIKACTYFIIYIYYINIYSS